MRNYSKSVFLLILSLICTYIIYKYHNFKSYINIYNNQSIDLALQIESYSNIRLDNVPSTKKDFNEMLLWLKGSKSISPILEYGINFKYNNQDKSLSVYSFGIDRKDNNLQNVLYSTSTDLYSPLHVKSKITDWSIFDIFNSKGKDVLLFKIIIDEDYLCRNYISNGFSKKNLLYSFSKSFAFFQGNKKVSRTLEQDLKDKIRSYELLISPDHRLDESIKISFIRFRNGKFYNVCSYSRIDLDIFDNELKTYLIDNNVDYAVIPILTKSNQEKKY